MEKQHEEGGGGGEVLYKNEYRRRRRPVDVEKTIGVRLQYLSQHALQSKGTVIEE